MTAPLADLRLGAALQSAKSPEWFTPAPIVEAARLVLGAIDLDPASCAQANETVQAARFYTAEDDGLAQPWSDRVFLNPPGGRGLVRQFWQRLHAHWKEGLVKQAIWIGYSLEQLQTLQGCDVSPLSLPLCFTNRRIAFVAPGGGKRSPTHSNYIAYLPPHRESAHGSFHRFARAFDRFGHIKP